MRGFSTIARTLKTGAAYGNRGDGVVLIPSMDSEDLEIRESDGTKASLPRDDERRRRFLVWPWLVVFGLLAIAAGVIGPLVHG
jgi:hypothetical protein